MRVTDSSCAYALAQPEVSTVLVPKFAIGHRLEPLPSLQFIFLRSVLIINQSSGNDTKSLNKANANVYHGT
jgi:hypothetical protein